MIYISVGLRILLSIAFLGAGGAKLAGVEMMVMTFDQIGWGQGFRYLTGAIEVIGVVLVTHSFLHLHTSRTTPDTPIGVCRVVSPLVNIV